jgi:hypothetical protein
VSERVREAMREGKAERRREKEKRRRECDFVEKDEARQ